VVHTYVYNQAPKHKAILCEFATKWHLLPITFHEVNINI